MRKQKFFDSKQLPSGEESQPGAPMMDFKRKTLNDIMVLRMLYLDYFFLFMGMNAQKAPDGSLADPNQYLFLMKEMQVKSEFKVHRSVLFLDKNVENAMGNKFLLSLGYDDNVDPMSGNVQETILVFKIWDFISLDHYVQTSLTGGTIWEKASHDSKGLMTPIMYRIEYDGKPYLDPVKKFSVSRDCMMAALVMHNNQILTYRLFEQDGHGNHSFVTEKKFQQYQRIFKHSEVYKEVIDLFITKN